mmetsp:Transcript_2953/g.6631  ORF Transcript_2953/g.6631 Transcript_2953/m.6631 type:complete len:236 (+) Transcript_2953:158-865(+)
MHQAFDRDQAETSVRYWNRAPGPFSQVFTRPGPFTCSPFVFLPGGGGGGGGGGVLIDCGLSGATLAAPWILDHRHRPPELVARVGNGGGMLTSAEEDDGAQAAKHSDEAEELGGPDSVGGGEGLEVHPVYCVFQEQSFARRLDTAYQMRRNFEGEPDSLDLAEAGLAHALGSLLGPRGEARLDPRVAVNHAAAKPLPLVGAGDLQQGVGHEVPRLVQQDVGLQLGAAFAEGLERG